MAKVSNKTVEHIFIKCLDNREHINYRQAIKAILANLQDEQMELVLDMLSSDEEFIPFKKNDYVKLDIQDYHLRKYFNYDTLKEMGLICKDTDKVYAKILDDTSWGSSYNAYNGQFKVEYLYHNDKHELHKHEDSVHSIGLQKVNKDDILYFKNLNNGKNKQTPIKTGAKELGITEEHVIKTSIYLW